jgi:hypothetical protein
MFLSQSKERTAYDKCYTDAVPSRSCTRMRNFFLPFIVAASTSGPLLCHEKLRKEGRQCRALQHRLQLMVAPGMQNQNFQLVASLA